MAVGMAVGTVSLPTDVGVFGVGELDELSGFFRAHGFAILRGLWSPETLAAVEAECEAVQRRLVAGELDRRYGTTILVDDADGARTSSFANYVTHVTEIAPLTRELIVDPLAVGLVRGWLGEACWLLEDARFGVVYQDARPGRESSYTRIGWHSDWQSAPHRDFWPSVAFTIHVDGTSPANGFLRVVPGSHLWATPAPFKNINNSPVPPGAAPVGGYTDTPPPYEMPLGFAKVPGEIAVYCEPGDLLFRDAYLWHSATRATEDTGVRRHIRGGWFVGELPSVDIADDFVKNAAR